MALRLSWEFVTISTVFIFLILLEQSAWVFPLGARVFFWMITANWQETVFFLRRVIHEKLKHWCKVELMDFLHQPRSDNWSTLKPFSLWKTHGAYPAFLGEIVVNGLRFISDFWERWSETAGTLSKYHPWNYTSSASENLLQNRRFA